MAKVGMEYVVSATLTEGSNGSTTYADAIYWGPSSSFSITPQANDVTDYGDDRAVEIDKSVNKADVSIELNESTLELESALLGHTYDSSSKEMVASRDDVAPFIGLGCVGKSLRNNTMVYRGIWLSKVKVAEPTDENTTKQESTSFNHSTYSGTAYTIGDTKGTLITKAEFSTLTAAKAWLDGKAGVTTSAPIKNAIS